MFTIIGCIVILIFVTSAWGKSCDTVDLYNSKQCSPTETCIPTSENASSGNCVCLPGYKRLNDSFCSNLTIVDDGATPQSSSLIVNQEDSGGSHVVAGILIPVFLIMVVISGVYFSRKYNLIGYVRSKLNRRNNNYDEVMIGQDLDDDDDPPLR